MNHHQAIELLRSAVKQCMGEISCLQPHGTRDKNVSILQDMEDVLSDTASIEPSATPAPASDPIYVECRECSCGHVGINDSSDTLAACHNCDWSGPSPVEDHCPGCADANCMGAACPKCGGIYKLLAESWLAAPATQEAPAEPVLPQLPKPLHRHPKLGEMFDRMQMHCYAAKHAEGLARLLDAAGIAPRGAQAQPVAYMTSDKRMLIFADNVDGITDDIATLTPLFAAQQAGAEGKDSEDAARYRWLVEKFGETMLPAFLERHVAHTYVADGKESIDAAIDAARASTDRSEG